MSALLDKRRGDGGFSLVELLVTCVIAGIIFLAMTPLFVNILKKTSTDSRRVVATNLAQARIERVRMLAYSDITQANLNSATFAAGQFNTSFTPAHGGLPYTITTAVSPSPAVSPSAIAVYVTVSRPGDAFATTAKTVITNPIALSVSATSGPTDPNGPHSLTVSSTKDWHEIKTAKVVIVNTSPTPNITTTATPATMTPNASATSCVWTNLPGGLTYMYYVTVTPQSPSSWSSGSFTAIPFHLISDDFKSFDTNPGGN